MNVLSTATAAAGITVAAAGMDYRLLTMLLAVPVPLFCAIALFICLRRADLKTRLIVFFTGMGVFVAADVFLFYDFQALVKKFLPVSLPEESGLLIALSLGTVFTGFCVLMCSAGVMRPWGRAADFVITLLFASVPAFLFCASAPLDYVPDLPGLFPVISFLPYPLDTLGIDIISLCSYVLFILLMFLCFLSNRNPEQITEAEKADIVRMNRLRHGVAGIDKAETCCGTCQYSQLLVSDKDHVVCDEKGIVKRNYICQDFLYDPIKRIPVRPPCPYAKTGEQLSVSSKPPEAAVAAAEAPAETAKAAPAPDPSPRPADKNERVSEMFVKLSRKNKASATDAGDTAQTSHSPAENTPTDSGENSIASAESDANPSETDSENK